MLAMPILDELNVKLVKLRGAGKDIYPALLPIFSAMDTSKTGELGASEFKVGNHFDLKGRSKNSAADEVSVSIYLVNMHADLLAGTWR
jgi:hypothetical protein